MIEDIKIKHIVGKLGEDDELPATLLLQAYHLNANGCTSVVRIKLSKMMGKKKEKRIEMFFTSREEKLELIDRLKFFLKDLEKELGL